ncbi:aspartyl-phosphate phosphatase Spo0E family protein [Alkaliphilus transvaalensis]|uniref:aspartyl-phosphate phosphatase Spo0E family protein n=1 Tax=Alkaliphilus transvaalensis TaxID=114628 RepID=UPI000A04D2E0|nr:aspartyl-phosphate phosphatase Spo0E family protein [Alkaliphilus transvaalensis]
MAKNDEINQLKEKIEVVRSKLNQMTREKKDCITDEETVSLSQELDDLLMEFIKRTRK